MEWWQRERRKPVTQRHPMVHWQTRSLEYLRGVEPGPDGIRTDATVPMRLFLELAHDFYTVEHNGLPVSSRLMGRLKNREQFQGARYELYVEALFLRSGLGVVREDEDDTQKTHCDFIATHTRAGVQYSVEVKSRHRDGLYGRPGTLPSLDQIKVDCYSLLREALRKQAEHQRVVFIDVNVPWRAGGPLGINWLPDASELLDRLDRDERRGPPWPPAIIVLTNTPYPYASEDETATNPQYVLTGVKMADFRNPNQDGEEAVDYAREVLPRYPGLEELTRRMTHDPVPLNW